MEKIEKAKPNLIKDDLGENASRIYKETLFEDKGE